MTRLMEREVVRRLPIRPEAPATTRCHLLHFESRCRHRHCEAAGRAKTLRPWRRVKLQSRQSRLAMFESHPHFLLRAKSADLLQTFADHSRRTGPFDIASNSRRLIFRSRITRGVSWSSKASMDECWLN